MGEIMGNLEKMETAKLREETVAGNGLIDRRALVAEARYSPLGSLLRAWALRRLTMALARTRRNG